MKKVPQKARFPAGKTLSNWTRAEFEALPFRKSWNEHEVFDDLVILPARKLHDSGYRVMNFVGVRKGVPVCLLSGCSDVVHFEGIGGTGRWNGNRRDLPESTKWNIDCLPRSGLLHLFNHGGGIEVGGALSSFEIFSI